MSISENENRLEKKCAQQEKALKLWLEFWDDIPKGQLGKIVCDIGLLNDAFCATREALN